MNQSDAQKIVIERISKLEPENIAKKIIGFMYFKDLTDQEMIRLAYGPDTLIHDLIQEAKNARLLALSQSLVISPPIPPTINHAAHAPLSDLSFQFPLFSSLSPRPLSSPYRRIDPHWIDNLPVEQLPPPMHNSGFKYMGMEEPQEAIKPGPSSFPDNYYCPEAAFNNLSIRGIRNSANPMAYPVKACYYYNKGYCKHGTNCKYFHGESFHESYAQSFCPNLYEEVGEDPGFSPSFSPASLKKLELEIIGLLKARRGSPVSIASLPMMYYEKYGKTLQAEGYLTESQRHGKVGYSLTKLLARLKSIQVIDRPHGQHSVILVEDAAKYMDFRTKRNDPGPIVTDSCQIFLTFTADCEFTSEDVSNYFSNYGPVQDVRIPERTYGFVSFVSADTVKQILSMGNPHFVCGARVLVKPYREKLKLAERKYPETFDHAAYYQSHHTDLDLQTNWDSSSSLSRRQLMEVQEHTIQLETMRLSQLQLACNYMGTKSCSEHPKFAPTERFNYLFGLNGGSSTNDNLRYPINNCGDQESTQGVNLPDSPFAAATGNNNVSAVI